MTITSSSRIPVLPLRDIVVFPHMIVPLFVGREKSVRALEEVMGSSKQILLFYMTRWDSGTQPFLQTSQTVTEQQILRKYH